jgi:triacylglycerol lipase
MTLNSRLGRGATVIVLAAVLLAVSTSASADVLALVHGYLGDAASWRSSGVLGALERDGWRDAGTLRYRARGVVATGRASRESERAVYTLDLPSEAPLLYQADALKALLDRIYPAGRKDKLIIIGHSAGGVVARLFMVRYTEPKVYPLITIASPHLGTDTAELGLMTSLSPLGFFAPLFGAETLNKSRGLYADLTRERPGTVLYWLNHQQHPNARYISVVRSSETLFGDMVVPTYSQDMNHVYALRGKARAVISSEGHGLARSDGPLLVRLLRELGE